MDTLELEAAQHIANERVALGSKMIAEGAYEDAKIAFGSVLKLGDSPAKSTVEAAQRGLAEAEACEYMSPEDLAGHSVYSHPVSVEEVQALLETDGARGLTTQPQRGGQMSTISPLSPTTSVASTMARQPHLLEVKFTQRSIGLVFEASDDHGPVWVAKIVDGSPAAFNACVRVGLILHAVRGHEIEGERFSRVMELLAVPERPVMLSFRLPPDEVSQAQSPAATRATPAAAAAVDSTDDGSGGALRRTGSMLQRYRDEIEIG